MTFGEICEGRLERGMILLNAAIIEILKFHGESCDLNTECYKNNCVKNKCIGKADGESCYNDYECLQESYCKDNNCTKYATKNGDCRELRCAFGYKCVETGNGVWKCLEHFSVKAGEIAEDEMLCESRYRKDVTYYDTRMKSDEEFQECGKNNCATEIINGEGNIVGENETRCEVFGPNGRLCHSSTSSKQWKNFVKTIKEVRDNISKNIVYQFVIYEVRFSLWYNIILL